MKKNIVFSRHAKRRMKLYDITEEDVLTLLDFVKDTNETCVIHSIRRFKYPIKVVSKENNEEIIIVTAYPLKRGKNENIL